MTASTVWILALCWALGGCASPGSGSAASAPAPVDTGVATPPITPAQSPAPVDTPPGAAQQADSGEAAAAQQADSGQQQGQAPQVSQAEYEGWRQYSVNCARCHGQDVLPNPVAANLLVSLAPGGPIDSPATFAQVVSEGRPHRGMPAFKGVLSPEQTQAIYAYVKGRADKRIPAGRPARPGMIRR